MSDKAWLSVKEAAESLGLGTAAVYQLAAGGKLACYRMGVGRGKLLFRPADLAEYAESCRVGPRPKAPRPAREEAYVPRYDLNGRRRGV